MQEPSLTTPARAELARIIVDEMYQLVGILDANGVNLESNRTSLVAAGLKREDVVGKYFWETPWWPDEVRPMLKDAVLRAAKGEFMRFEVENKVEAGSIWVDFSLKPVRDNSGDVRFIIPEGRDITAKKQAEDEIRRKNTELENAYSLLQQREAELRKAHAAAERALELSEERLQLATKTAQLGFWDLNFETGRLFWDQTLRAMFGYAPGDFHPSMDEFYNRLHPDDVEAVKNLFQTAIEDHKDFNAEYRIVWPDGSPHYFVATGRGEYDSRGKPLRISGVVIEVTERKLKQLELETRFRELAESMPQIVFTASSDGHFLYFNRNWFDYTGESREALCQESWNRAIHPEDLPKVLSTARDARIERKPWELEFRIKRADATYRWHLARSVPSYDGKGNITRWYGAVTDINDQKRAQQALSHAVHVRDDFLSIASHELKTPLTSLKLQIQLQQRRLERDELRAPDIDWARNSVRTSERQIARITRLIDDMLDVSRIDTGKLSVQLDEFDLGEAVAETLAQLQPQFDAAGCTVNLIVDGPVRGRWDRFRLEQVILNLLTNAFKYGAGRPVEIRVRRAGDRTKLSIRDFGVGISPEDHARIFKRFERAADMDRISGLGLGLYISQHIVEMHCGAIRLESAPGKGSVFTVELPLDPAAARLTKKASV